MAVGECKGAHCKCMRTDCINFHYGDHKCYYSANAALGLPRDKMKTITICFDVDGTLRCNCTETCTDANIDIVALFHILNKFKNTLLYVWSGGGAIYSRNAAMRYGLAIPESRCISKLSGFKPDIAIDDIQDTALGIINLIVRQK